jgi:hypothetical protein
MSSKFKVKTEDGRRKTEDGRRKTDAMLSLSASNWRACYRYYTHASTAQKRAENRLLRPHYYRTEGYPSLLSPLFCTRTCTSPLLRTFLEATQMQLLGGRRPDRVDKKKLYVSTGMYEVWEILSTVVSSCNELDIPYVRVCDRINQKLTLVGWRSRQDFPFSVTLLLLKGKT